MFNLSREQFDRLENLNSMIAYVNHATGCAICSEMKATAPLHPEYVDGFFLLSAHLTDEIRKVLDAVSPLDDKSPPV